MKTTDKRAVMEALLAGKKVKYFFNDKDGNFSPLSWSNEFGIVDNEGDQYSLYGDSFEIIEPKREIWVNVYDEDYGKGHPSREDADLRCGNGRIACIRVEFTEGEGL